jgi:dephospho-CoA kinase
MLYLEAEAAVLAGLYDLVVVDVPVETQLARLVRLRGMTEEHARADRRAGLG